MSYAQAMSLEGSRMQGQGANSEFGETPLPGGRGVGGNDVSQMSALDRLMSERKEKFGGAD